MVLARTLSLLKVLVSVKRKVDWEVVDSKVVEPVHLWDIEDDDDIVYIHDSDVIRTYQFDVRNYEDLQKVVTFAQDQMLLEIRSRGYNALWTEGWRLTILRRAARERVEVRYVGRPAKLNATPDKTPPPPFIDVLQHLELIAL
ncbi:hypothetical protein K488DRAFT_44484 [Vararia minispora EC-137]|uniref:Uncharacterized protein n=1 Tax=Vararia minispora EC-137 TaxID=1314806 RepID=A0ACB8QT89_9AGAM|nr:hypothetical protein K488DRAFT_44484 [Vararia minispora EC-137]